MSDSKAVVFSKNACGFCIRAKNILKRKGIEIEEVKIGEDVTLEEAQNQVGKPFRTVPQILLDGEYIGGYDQLCEHYGIKAR